MPKLESLIDPLLEWFQRNARDLPWRRTTDPYAIWVSEIMLQQTQVKTVIPYWNRWMGRFPTVQLLADAHIDEILKLWEGLGYYTRARNLHRAAETIVMDHGGLFPREFEQVLELPGIGRYTAGAICSIAFNQRKPILDGNVTRVLTRLFAIAENPRLPKANQRLWKLAQEFVELAAKPASDRPSRACSALNQALMELGATICTARQPRCPTCPLQKHCRAFRENRVDRFPNLGARPSATARHFVAFVIRADGRFLVRQRPLGVVNARLWEFPNIEVTASDRTVNELAEACLNARPRLLEPICQITHTITRYRIRVNVVYGEVSRPTSPPLENGRWCKLKDLDRLAFPSAHRKIANIIKTPRQQNLWVDSGSGSLPNARSVHTDRNARAQLSER